LIRGVSLTGHRGLKIHLLENGEVVVFSRNSENMSAKYPDLIESAPKVRHVFRNVQDQSLIFLPLHQWHGPDVTSFVIDSEAVAYDIQTKKLLPFQDLSRRKRKDVRTEDITVRVHVFAFDLLYLNGEVSVASSL
jgi:DNA ligase-1